MNEWQYGNGNQFLDLSLSLIISTILSFIQCLVSCISCVVVNHQLDAYSCHIYCLLSITVQVVKKIISE